MTIEILPHITDLQGRKTQTETYQTFHELYSGRQLANRGFSLILNRVLQIDDFDNSLHAVVAKHDIQGERILPTLRMRRGNLVRYNHAEVKVALTNGKTIAEYDACGVYGIYKAMGGKIHPRRKLGEEQLSLNILSQEGSLLGRAEFERGSGNGNFYFADHTTGKILGAEESDHLRQVALHDSIQNSVSVAS